jgi:hypothetical protein
MEPLAPPPFPPPSEPPRHGCLLAWIILMIVSNALTAVITPFSMAALQQAGTNVPGMPEMKMSGLNIALVVVCCLANVLFAVALLRWRKWGFYGFLVTTLIALANNLMIGLGIGVSIFGLLGIIVLYAVLQLGSPKGWTQLR